MVPPYFEMTLTLISSTNTPAVGNIGILLTGISVHSLTNSQSQSASSKAIFKFVCSRLFSAPEALCCKCLNFTFFLIAFVYFFIMLLELFNHCNQNLINCVYGIFIFNYSF